MILNVLNHVRTAIILFFLMLFITGIFYPFAVTEIAQALFPWRANGSLILDQDKLIGSELIGQDFADDGYFWGRLSATLPFPYTGDASSGSNWGLNHPDLLSTADGRLLAFLTKIGPAIVPLDLLTSSASGLDPDITPEGAYFQVQRIARARHLDPEIIYTIINNEMKQPWARLLGKSRINVLELNLTLDKLNHIL